MRSFADPRSWRLLLAAPVKADADAPGFSVQAFVLVQRDAPPTICPALEHGQHRRGVVADLEARQVATPHAGLVRWREPFEPYPDFVRLPDRVREQSKVACAC